MLSPSPIESPTLLLPLNNPILSDLDLKDQLEKISIDSVLGDLPSYEVVVDTKISGKDVSEVFERDALLPGVLVIENGILQGILSREMFFERTGKRFGTEIYYGRPIKTILETIPSTPFILQSSLLIALATKQALSREIIDIYEPIVVVYPGSVYRLINPLILFIAQSRLLLELHEQRLFTVSDGQDISTRDAILLFIKYAGNQKIFNLEMFIKKHAVRCDQCSRTVNYALVDVVRSFPQLNRGVVIEEKMGVRSYRLYIRHHCINREIWEIPLHLDDHLEYRSQRPARAVERYA